MPRVQPVHAPPPAERDGGDAVGQGVLGVGVEGAHQRQLAGGAQRVPGDDRDDRLVDVRDVVAALAQLAPQRAHGVRRHRHVGDGAVGRRCPTVRPSDTNPSGVG